VRLFRASSPRREYTMEERAATEVLSESEARLRDWMSRWYDHAVAVGLVRPPWRLDDARAARLEGYFIAGLTPEEGAQAFFGTVH
jgi:hypothetical protein